MYMHPVLFSREEQKSIILIPENCRTHNRYYSELEKVLQVYIKDIPASVTLLTVSTGLRFCKPVRIGGYFFECCYYLVHFLFWGEEWDFAVCVEHLAVVFCEVVHYGQLQ